MRRIKLLSLLFLTAFFCQATTQTPATSIKEKKVEFEVFKVYGLNSEFAEFSPVLYKTDFIFASDRAYDYNIIGEDNWSNTKHINIFKAEVKNNTSDSIVFAKVKIFDDIFLDDDHSGPISFSADGETAIFTKVTHRKTKLFGDKYARPQLYQAVNKNGKWEDMRKLSFVKVTNTYGHPTLSTDGKKLFFVSDAFGGKGGKDIFVSELTPTGWGEPSAINAINTAKDELFPTLVGNQLYFSSNGRGGEGGMDLFVSELINGQWSEPINLGTTINTSYDEFGMVFNPNGMSGFFSSNRESGEGEDDIYYFNKIETVTVEDNSISGQFTYRFLEDKNANGLEVMLLDEDGNLISTTRTNEDGTFDFRNLDPNKRYTVKLNEEGEEVELALFNGGDSAFLLANNEGEFVYRKLSDENVGTLALMDEESIDPITKEGELKGQFVYTRLESGIPAGIEVLLVDDDGNIIQRTTTDENGNFVFKKLAADKNYTIKTGNLNEDTELYIFDNQENVSATLASNKDGYFVYRKLNSEAKDNLSTLLLDEQELDFSATTSLISGEFKYRTLDKVMEDVEYEIFDDYNNLLIKSTTDDRGFFRHYSIPDQDKLIFKINGKKYPEDVDLIILDRSKEVVVRLDKDNDGFFIYQKLKSENTGINAEEELLAMLKRGGTAGQFLYKKLDAAAGGLEYEIYDEDGMLIRKGKTDENGIFHEPDLEKKDTYKYKLLNTDEDVYMRYWDEESNQLLVLDKSSDDFFAYNYLEDNGVGLATNNVQDNEMLVRFNNGKLFSNLFYAKNIYKLSAGNKTKIDELVNFMKSTPGAKVAVTSHASQTGSDEYNSKLSERRLKEVVEYIIESGIDESRFEAKYFGEGNPLVDCESKKCNDTDRRQNRRTEIKILK